MAAAPPRSDARARPGEQVRARALGGRLRRGDASRRRASRRTTPRPVGVGVPENASRVTRVGIAPVGTASRGVRLTRGAYRHGLAGDSSTPTPRFPARAPASPSDPRPPLHAPPLAQQPDKTTSRLIKPSASTPTSPPPRPRGTASTTRREPAARSLPRGYHRTPPPSARRRTAGATDATPPPRRHPRARVHARRRGAGDGDARCSPNAAGRVRARPANAPTVSSVARTSAAAAAGPAVPGDGVNLRGGERGGGGGGDGIQATFGKKARAEFAASRESPPEGGDSPPPPPPPPPPRRSPRREPSRGFRFGGGDVGAGRPPSLRLAVGGVRGDGDRLARPRGALGAPPRARSPARVQDHDRRGRVVRVRSRGVPRVESRRRLGGSRRVEFLRRNRREFSRAHVLERAARDPTPPRRG